jgi:hypothetical protein
MAEPTDDVAAARATMAVMTHLVDLGYSCGFTASGIKLKRPHSPRLSDRGKYFGSGVDTGPG